MPDRAAAGAADAAYRIGRHEVVVHVEDLEYVGQRYKSISRISKVITGTN
jgi:hypothetical protein